MKPLPRFIYGQGQENELGAGVIIINQEPPYVGQVILFNNVLTMQQQLRKTESVAYSVITGYCIAVIYRGILGKGNRISGIPSDIAHAQSVIDEMANWYYESRILPYLSRFKRYLVS
jgi:hypothetical protein